MQIENKATKMILGEGKYINYFFLIKSALNTMPKNGLTAEDMQEIEDLKTIFDEEKSEIQISSRKQLEWIQQLTKETRWQVNHEDIINFCNEIKNLQFT